MTSLKSLAHKICLQKRFSARNGDSSVFSKILLIPFRLLYDFGYGLLPFPKWDESQKDYATMLQRNCFMLIPVTVEDTDMVSAVMEALASESYRSLLPEYCEVTLKTRYSQDDNVSRMFDLIGGSIVFDPGEIYSGVLGAPSADIKTRISANDPNWASFVAGKKDSLIEKMNSIIK